MTLRGASVLPCRSSVTRRARFAAFAAFATTFAFAGSTLAFCRATTCKNCSPDPLTGCIEDGAPLFWTQRCISFSVELSGSPQVGFAEASDLAERAFRSWWDTTCPQAGRAPSILLSNAFGGVICDRHEYNKQQSNANVLMFQTQWPYTNVAFELARTTITFSTTTGEIFDADMEINADQPLTTETPVPEAPAVDLLSVMTHEAGHFLGLAHSSQDSIMQPRYQPGTDGRTLTSDDVDAICAAYPPDRVTPPCDFSPRNGFSAECALDPSSGRSCALARREPQHSPGWSFALLSAAVWAAGRGRRRWRATPARVRRRSL